MADYQKMYSLLFNEMTDAVEDLEDLIERVHELRERFVKIQQRCEEIYTSANEETVKMKLVRSDKNEVK